MIETVAVIASLISAFAAFGATAVSLMSYRASRRNGQKIEEVHVSINSRMDQLLAARGESSEAKGLALGRAEVRPGEEMPVKVEITKIPPLTPTQGK